MMSHDVLRVRKSALAGASRAYGRTACTIGMLLGVFWGFFVGSVASSSAGRVRVESAAFVSLAALGREGVLEALPEDTRIRVARDVNAQRAPGVTEWWRTRPEGLEHGVTLGERPEGTGALVLALDVGGDLRPRSVGADEIALEDRTGRRHATYSGLVVLDGDGARVPARLGVADGRITIRVHDRDAVYPIVVDPLLEGVEEATITDGEALDGGALSTAMAADGTRIALGDPYGGDSTLPSQHGAVYVLARQGTAWTREAVFGASDGAPRDAFGGALALSADGSELVVGAQPRGQAYLFERSGTSWTETTILVPTPGFFDFGLWVALAPDGSRAFVSGWLWDDSAPHPQIECVWVFTRTAGGWVQEDVLRFPYAASAWPHFGAAMAVSDDASYVAIGAPTWSGPAGSGVVFGFARTGSQWTLDAELASPVDAVGDLFGQSIAISASGSDLVIGSRGEAHVYSRTGGVWTRTHTLPADRYSSYDQRYGWSVSLSADGNRLLAGAPVYSGGGVVNAGAALVLERSGTSWSPVAFITRPEAMLRDGLGAVSILSADGSRAFLGRYQPSSEGAGWIFRLEPARELGVACRDGATCVSGSCTEGVCCDSACGGGAANDCQSCRSAQTGVEEGHCAPLLPAIASTVVCRPSIGTCDVADTCEPGSTECPDINRFASSDVECRAAAGECDVAEHCTGWSASCPYDARLGTTAVCRPSAGDCDPVEERCDGIRSTCPPDVMLPAGTVCRDSSGPCSDVSECDGISPVCPLALRRAGTVCNPATPGYPCDADDVCDGVTAGCARQVAPAGTSCQPRLRGGCDAPDFCDGSSELCLDSVLPAGTVCNRSFGACDPEEVCPGDDVLCPTDQQSPVGTVCRASRDPSCDRAEICYGGLDCPDDSNFCPDSGVVDAGTSRDAGPADAGQEAGLADGAVPGDGGAPPMPVGCACRAGEPRGPLPAAWGLWVGLALVVARRVSRRVSCVQ